MNDKLETRVMYTALFCSIAMGLTIIAAVGVDIYLKLENRGTRHITTLEVKP